VAPVTQEIYEELLKLDAKVERLAESLEETVAFMRETNRELAEGQAKTEALKQKLFGDRLKRMDAAE
jgi:peptidoglycan hydrolase CwlO-like protein